MKRNRSNLYARTCLTSLPSSLSRALQLAGGWRLLERKNVRVVVITRISYLRLVQTASNSEKTTITRR